jgi:hypothetical protein
MERSESRSRIRIAVLLFLQFEWMNGADIAEQLAALALAVVVYALGTLWTPGRPLRQAGPMGIRVLWGA